MASSELLLSIIVIAGKLYMTIDVCEKQKEVLPL